jgi:hypothetical protein
MKKQTFGIDTPYTPEDNPSEALVLKEGESIGEITFTSEGQYIFAELLITSEGRDILMRIRLTRYGVKRLDRNGVIRPGHFKLIERETLVAALAFSKKKGS